MRGTKKFGDECDYTDGGLDAGLLVLSVVTPPGVELGLREIADVCGCDQQDIWHIERRAMKKIKAEFERRGINADF